MWVEGEEESAVRAVRPDQKIEKERRRKERRGEGTLEHTVPLVMFKAVEKKKRERLCFCPPKDIYCKC